MLDKNEELMMSRKELIDGYVHGHLSRRQFMRSLVAAGMTAGAAAVYASSIAPAASAAPAEVLTDYWIDGTYYFGGEVFAGEIYDLATTPVYTPGWPSYTIPAAPPMPALNVPANDPVLTPGDGLLGSYMMFKYPTGVTGRLPLNVGVKTYTTVSYNTTRGYFARNSVYAPGETTGNPSVTWGTIYFLPTGLRRITSPVTTTTAAPTTTTTTAPPAVTALTRPSTPPTTALTVRSATELPATE